MSKKNAKTSEKQLTIVGITLRRSASVSDIARGSPPRLELTIEVENEGDAKLFVWTDCRSRKYDGAAHTLSIQLAEPVDALPPHIKMISDHPRLPSQAAVDPKSRFKIKLQLPGTVRRLTPGQGLGKSFVDDPIGAIDHVDISIQYGPEKIQHQSGEAPAEFRKRLRAHGHVAQATIAPTEGN